MGTYERHEQLLHAGSQDFPALSLLKMNTWIVSHIFPFFICGLETSIVATILTRKKKIFLFALSQVQLLTGDSGNAKIPGTAAEPAPSEAEINAPSCTLISSAPSLPPLADSAVKVSHISKLAFHP